MYSHASNAVDKGLGFDFSAIADLVKSALPVGLNIYQNQMQLKTVKAMAAGNINNGIYNPAIGLPAAQMYGLQPTFGQPGYRPPQSSMFDTSTMLIIGAAGVIGLLAYKMLR
jgi:hypothetical protein